MGQPATFPMAAAAYSINKNSDNYNHSRIDAVALVAVKSSGITAHR